VRSLPKSLSHLHNILEGTGKVVIEQLLSRCNGVADVAQVVRKIEGTTASRNGVEQRLATSGTEQHTPGKNLSMRTACEPSAWLPTSSSIFDLASRFVNRRCNSVYTASYN
jgi:hypothetical protein